MTEKSYPTGRSDYRPGRDWNGPQAYPDEFSTEDIVAEIKYLIGLNSRYGSNVLRTVAYTKLIAYLRDERGYTGKL